MVLQVLYPSTGNLLTIADLTRPKDLGHATARITHQQAPCSQSQFAEPSHLQEEGLSLDADQRGRLMKDRANPGLVPFRLCLNKPPTGRKYSTV